MDVVNGYRCRDNTDREYAKQGIDPASPQKNANKEKSEKDMEVVSRANADTIRLTTEAQEARKAARERAMADADAAAAAAKRAAQRMSHAVDVTA